MTRKVSFNTPPATRSYLNMLMVGLHYCRTTTMLQGSSHLLLLRNQREIVLESAEIIIDSGPETDLIKNTLDFPGEERERNAARSWVNNGYTDIRGGTFLT